MKLSPMSYKGYVWPHNPKNCAVTAGRAVTNTKLPGKLWHVSDTGRSYRVITGSGEFSGDDAYSKFMELYDVFCLDGKGTLYHPVIGSVTACFSSLTLNQEPKANYVSYSFRFDELGEDAVITQVAAAEPVKQYHTLAYGESFWTLCQLYGLTASHLAELNPELQSPTTLTVGQILRVK